MSTRPTTDEEWVKYLSSSSDLDDQSLVARIRLVEELKAKGSLNQRESQFMAVASAINRLELDFIK